MVLPAADVYTLYVMQREPSMFALERARVKLFLQLGLQASNSISRLLCIKVAGELLVYMFSDEGAMALKVESAGGKGVNSMTEWAIEIIQSVMVSCNDVDHLIRIGSAGCLGSFFKAVFGEQASALRDQQAAVALRPLRGRVCHTLLKVCRDPIGTVRTEGAAGAGRAAGRERRARQWQRQRRGRLGAADAVGAAGPDGGLEARDLQCASNFRKERNL
jgi:hypothetical protein